MNILVCIKQVIDLASRLRIAASEEALDVDEYTQYRMNEPDLYAVEAALRLRDAGTEAEIDIVSVGPPRVVTAIRRAMGMGADRGILIEDNGEQSTDPSSVAFYIAQTVKKRGYDLILAGIQSEDTMQGAVGPMLAAMLGIPCVIGVVKIELKEDRIEAIREMDGGRHDCLSLPMPCLIAIQTSSEKPRYPSVSNMLIANRADLEIREIKAGESPRPRQSIVRLLPPPATRECIMLEGTSSSKAKHLLRLLAERNVL